MPMTATESLLEGITITIAHLEKEGNCDPKLMEILKENRGMILKRLNLD